MNNRRFIYYFVIALFIYLVLESTSYALYYLTQDKPLSFSELREQRQVIAREKPVSLSGEPGALENPCYTEVLHPYLGFVRAVQEVPKGGEDCDAVDLYAYEFGFPDPDVAIYSRQANRVIVGIFGGSFAQGLSLKAEDILIDELRLSPCFAGKTIEVLTLAMGGYKQPQQLLTLAYFLSLGAHFDVVINIDGFNEVVLPATENIAKQVFPFYPRNWFGRVEKFDPAMLTFTARRDQLTEKRSEWAALFLNPLRFSITANVIWWAYDRLLSGRIANLQIDALEYEPAENTGDTVSGPDFHYADDEALYSGLATVWKDASIQMGRLVAANDGLYLHFLQPNQYVPDSKPMHEAERKLALHADHPYRKSVENGYPALIEAGRQLKDEGIRFHDLTQLFRGHREALYVDDCCHLERPGYGMINRVIAQEIRGILESAEAGCRQ